MGKAHVLQGLYVSNMTPSRRGWCSGRVSATYAGPTWPVQQGAAATGRQSRFQRSPEGPQTWGTVPHSTYIEFLASGSFFTGAGYVDTAQMFLLYTRKSRVKVSEPPRSQRGRAGLVHGCSVVQQCPFAVCRLPHRARSFCAASRCRSCRRPDHGWLRARSEPSWSSKTPLPSRLLPPDRWWV